MALENQTWRILTESEAKKHHYPIKGNWQIYGLCREHTPDNQQSPKSTFAILKTETHSILHIYLWDEERADAEVGLIDAFELKGGNELKFETKKEFEDFIQLLEINNSVSENKWDELPKFTQIKDIPQLIQAGWNPKIYEQYQSKPLVYVQNEKKQTLSSVVSLSTEFGISLQLRLLDESNKISGTAGLGRIIMDENEWRQFIKLLSSFNLSIL